MSDKETLAVYGARAQAYSDIPADAAENENLTRFLAALPPGGRVLDWGAGPGIKAAWIQSQGFEVVATDATPEFAEAAQRLHGLELRVELFDALDAEASFDGILASFSLLHAPKSQMPRHLAQAHRALKPGGQFCLSLKTGQGEARDEIGRFYAYYEETEIKDLLAQAGFTVTGQDTGTAIGLDGKLWPWITLHAHA